MSEMSSLRGDGEENRAIMSAKKKLVLIVLLVIAYLVWGSIISLQPPFYPKEAEAKGATPSQYGFVFGIAPLAAFLVSPLCGIYGEKIGVKILYNFGAFAQGISTGLMGFLEYVDQTDTFLGLSYALRFISGVADALAWSSLITILMVIFPNKTSLIIGTTQLVFGVGFAIGPVIGSALYKAGGFGMPFWVVGATGCVVAICLHFMIPNVKGKNADSSDATRTSLTIKDVFKSPTIFIPLVDTFIVFSGYGFINGMLEPYMKDHAGASQNQVGTAFFLMGVTYTISSAATGLILNKLKYPVIVSLIGNILMVITYLFIGPVPFLNIQPSVELIYVMISFGGTAYSIVIVSTLARSQGAAKRIGYTDDVPTYQLISGLWSSSTYLGIFVGPTVGGFLVENIGFAQASVCFMSLLAFSTLADMAELTYMISESPSAAPSPLRRLLDIGDQTTRLLAMSVHGCDDDFFIPKQRSGYEYLS